MRRRHFATCGVDGNHDRSISSRVGCGTGKSAQPRPNGNYTITGLTNEIVVKDHYWHCPDSGHTGNAIDFLKVRRNFSKGGFVQVRGVTFNEALTLLTQSAGS